MSQYCRTSVEKFMVYMENRLKEKDDDCGAKSWLDNDCNIDELRNSLQTKVSILHKCCFDLDVVGARKSCIDVANFAMMIVDRIDLNKEEDIA